MRAYPGINPHLNSALQQPDGGWEMFHTRHVNDLAATLDAQLPAHYYAVAETFASNDNEDEAPDAVVIYRLREGQLPGTPVTRLELLSPGNKAPGAHAAQYLRKRQETLRGGLRLVEIDYLHEQRPLLHLMPSYPDGDPSATPYTILISDPTPDPNTGQTRIFGWHVADPLPMLDIPLKDGDSLALDFNAVYAQSLATLKILRLLADARQPPANLHTYSLEDQQTIRAVMSAS